MTLVSEITTNAPLQVIEIEGPIYLTTKQTIKIPNVVQIAGKFSVIPRYLDTVPDARNMSGLMKNLLIDPTAERQYQSMRTLYESMLQKHQHFLFIQKKIEFETDDDTERLDVEFIPISLGEFLCLILFYCPGAGEFIFHLIGRATLPSPQSCGLNLKAEAGQAHTEYITFDQTNRA
jgi:hypothetical protein